MFLISHRGNLSGRDVKLENNPTQIQKVLDLGYHCEIDVWYINGVFLLGHDFPTIAVSEYDLENSKLWCHAKTVESLQKMLTNKWLGDKTKQGFYKKDRDKKGNRTILALNLKSFEYSEKKKIKFETIFCNYYALSKNFL